MYVSLFSFSRYASTEGCKDKLENDTGKLGHYYIYKDIRRGQMQSYSCLWILCNYICTLSSYI